ncbi:hypothetical protein Q5530_12205 [Saccharothrix sp. BKS2]|uniref:hypothetical protein n=1 Tax=Saccharothrix sp. BKS2 TaxID=3064400 RepID=UPI0039EC0ECD
MTDGTAVGPHRLDVAVRSTAEAILQRLDGEAARLRSLDGSGPGGNDVAVTVAAVRVLGADVLAPCALLGQRLDPVDHGLVTAALRCFPPGPDPLPVDRWLHWGLARAMVEAGVGDVERRDVEQPGVRWVADLPWPVLGRQVAHLAALAVPGTARQLVAAVRGRAPDLARGCVRALLRRDWLQAAGCCRWLALLGDPVPSLGLVAALAHLEQAARDDPRTLLHVRIARMLGAEVGP